MFGVDGLSWGTGYGEAEAGEQANTAAGAELHDDKHATGFFNYSYGPVTFGYQMSYLQKGASQVLTKILNAWGLAWNVNENLSISYGEREVEYEQSCYC